MSPATSEIRTDKKVGLLAAFIAVAVAMVTIASHRAHRSCWIAKDVSEAARKTKLESALSEHQALRYDLGEAMLEVGLVLCSIYFISKRRIFPPMGVAVSLLGAGIALTGLLLR